MESEEPKEILLKQLCSAFLSGEDLVNLRKQGESEQSFNIGLKFSERSGTATEEDAVNAALNNHMAVLTQKRAARICDLMQAEWNEELNACLATKLKGKFVQHMGRRVNDKIALTPEESLFLLESGCLEILNGKTPMSTEEAFAIMLKQKLSAEKYSVYCYLSQLGFIVIPHQKEANKKSQSKVTDTERTPLKRKNPSPLPNQCSSKRLTFSGVLSEKPDISKNSKANEEKELLNDLAIISEVEASDVENTTAVSENGTHVEKSVDACVDDKEVTHSNQCEVVSDPPCSRLENSKNDSDIDVDCEMEESNGVKPVISASALEMDTNSQNTEGLLDSLDKAAGAFVAETEEGSINEANTKSSDELSLYCSSIENEANTCDEISQEVLNLDEENNQGNLYIDEDITLLAVKKKETTPLAVIDLLSDDEEQEEEIDPLGNSDSDDDIKILEVYNGSSNKDKNSCNSFDSSKLKSKKISDYKVEEANNQTNQPSSTPLQFPEIYRKDLVCVARPFANLLPLHVQPAKEVYILDCAKLQTNRLGPQAATGSQPQGRMWNSFRDMQDYQRSLRRDRRDNRHQNRDKPWLKSSRHHDDGSYHRHSNNIPNFRSSFRDKQSDLAHTDPHSRRSGDNYRDHRRLRNQLTDFDSHSHNGVEDQKPFASSHSPLMLGNNDLRPNLGDFNSLSVPSFSNSTFVNSLSIRHPSMPFGSQLNNPSGNLPDMSSFSSPDFVAEVHRTAYSYATTMLSSMFGSSFNPNNFPSPVIPFPSVRHASQFRTPMPMAFGNHSNYFPNGFAPVPENRPYSSNFRGRKHHSSEPFPCHYRNVRNKRSWTDVKAAVRENGKVSDSDSSDIEEIPINTNEFLWNASNICPLVKPGIKHPASDVLKSLQLTQLAKLTDKTSRYEKCFPNNQTLEIVFDVYKPSTNFKKSCPGIPYSRIIVTKATDQIPRFSEIALFQRKWSDGAFLQVAVVDGADISFCSFNSVGIPDIVPFED